MMKKLIYKRSFMITLAIFLVMTILTIGTGALSFREGMGPTDNNSPSDSSTIDSTASDSTAESDVNGGAGSNDTTMPPPNDGTGEFADDTSNNGGTSAVTSNDTSRDTSTDSSTPLDPDAGLATDGDGFIDDGEPTETTDNNTMSVWGIVIAIIIIAAIAILIFVFFAKKK